MISRNPMQLKAYLRNFADRNKISAQLVLQNFMMERLLERISISNYHTNFILKGGFLISSIVGLSSRTTMDMDTTLKGLELSHDVINEVFKEICDIKLNDNIKFVIYQTTNIREGDEYPGIRVSLIAHYMTINVPLKVDITIGDKITPKEIDYSFKLLFEDKIVSILAYNLETILSEKLETVLSRGDSNTRPRDYYDLYILYLLRFNDIDINDLYKAFIATCEKRGSTFVIKEYVKIIDKVKASKTMNNFWLNYQKDFEYAKNIEFIDTCNVVLKIMEMIDLD